MGEEAKDEVTIWTYSDDCAGISGRPEIDESSLWGEWHPLVIGEEVVAEVMVDYGSPDAFNGGWQFSIRSLDDQEIDIEVE